MPRRRAAWRPTAAEVTRWQHEGRVVEEWGVVAHDAASDEPHTPLPRTDASQSGLRLVLPYPPGGNNLYPTGRDGRRHLSAAARAYHAAVAQAVLAQVLLRQPRPPLPFTGRLIATVRVYPPDRRRRDIMDNTNKLVFDALTACGVLADDSLIDEGHIYRGGVSPVARVEVTLMPSASRQE